MAEGKEEILRLEAALCMHAGNWALQSSTGEMGALQLLQTEILGYQQKPHTRAPLQQALQQLHLHTDMSSTTAFGEVLQRHLQNPTAQEDGRDCRHVGRAPRWENEGRELEGIEGVNDNVWELHFQEIFEYLEIRKSKDVHVILLTPYWLFEADAFRAMELTSLFHTSNP